MLLCLVSYDRRMILLVAPLIVTARSYPALNHLCIAGTAGLVQANEQGPRVSCASSPPR